MSNEFDPSKFHHLKPDYSQPILEIPLDAKQNILSKLELLYDKELAEKWYPEFERIMKVYYAHKTPQMLEWQKEFQHVDRFTEKDVFLITYGDLIRNHDDKPLQTMHEICSEYLHGVFNTVHILPFYPYSSDRFLYVIIL